MNILQTDLTLSLEQAGAVLSAWLGNPVACTRIHRLRGGMINTVLRLDFDREPFSAVIKLSSSGGSFAAGSGFAVEAEALAYLRQHTRFPSPQVYLLDEEARVLPYASLLIETIPGDCLAGLELTQVEYDDLDRQLAAALLDLHSHTGPHFGSINGASVSDRWTDVFLPRLHEVRPKPELAERLPLDVLAQVDRAIQLAETALSDQGPPTLIHGDIWAGNLIVRREAAGWQLAGIVDPGLYYADVEAELAYLEVFDNPRSAFFTAYTAHSPLRPGYQRRRLFYWLYTALLHVWLFGDQHYCDFTARTAAAICSDSA